MLITHGFITLDLPFISSLKGRRKIVNSIKDRLKHQNISIADISGEYVKEAIIEFAFLVASEHQANNKIEKIEKLLEKYFSDIEHTISYEII